MLIFPYKSLEKLVIYFSIKKGANRKFVMSVSNFSYHVEQPNVGSQPLRGQFLSLKISQWARKFKKVQAKKTYGIK